MPTVRLTDRGLRALETDRQQADYYDELLPGLGVRVSGATGRKTFFVRYRQNGSHRRMKLGTYPRLSLADARDKAREALQAAQDGEDPAHARRERKAGARSFEALAREVLKGRARRTRESTQSERDRLLEKELLPVWGDRDADSISRREVVQLVERIADRAPVVANRTLSLVKLIFNDGLRRGFPGLEANPAHLVEPPTEETGRDRYLDRPEIRTVWKALEPESELTAAIFKLCLLTAQRVGAVCSIAWKDVTGDLWRIPAERFKGKRVHLVPLSPDALEVLDRVRLVSGEGEWAFPSREGTKLPHLSNMNNALRRIRERTPIPSWTLHDMRTTFRTWATRPADPEGDQPAGLGVSGEVADLVLGHALQGVGFRHYTADKARYRLAEKRDALRKWGAFVREALEDDG